MTKVILEDRNVERIVNSYKCLACQESFLSSGMPNYCPECGEEIAGAASEGEPNG